MNRENVPLKDVEAAPSDTTVVPPIRRSPNDAFIAIETNSSEPCWLKCMKFIGDKKISKLIGRGLSLFIILSLIIGIPERVLKFSSAVPYRQKNCT